MSEQKEKQRPSNGGEGCEFQGSFCDQCAHEKYTHTGNDNDPMCPIFSRAVMYDVDDPEYPNEWTYDENGQPTCTNFKKHIWRDKFTGELIEPETIYPVDPDQLDLFDYVTGH